MEVFEVKRKDLGRKSSRPRSKMTFLLVIAGSLFIILSGLIFFNFILGHKQLKEPETEFLQTVSKDTLLDARCETDFCDTKGCVSIASRLLEIMDLTADPCQDFYQYACGNYGRARAVRYNEDYYSPVKETNTNILVNIKKLLEEPSPDDESQSLRKTKQFYESCMNSSRRNDEQMETLNSWFVDIQLSLKDDVAENVLDPGNYGSWRRLLSNLEAYGIHTVLKPKFKYVDENPIGILEVDCLMPRLLPDTYVKPAEVEHEYQLSLYKEVMDNALKLLSMEKKERQEFISGIIELETQIATSVKAHPTPSTDLSVEHKQQLKEVWRSLVGDNIGNTEVTSSCKHNLDDLLTVLNDADAKKSYRYVVWIMLTKVMQFMGNDFRDLYLHYLGRLPGVDYVWMSIWKECTDIVQEELGLVATKGLLDNGYFSADQLSQVKDMFWELKTSFAHVFRMIPWLDDTTRDMFLEKLKNIKFTTGYPPIINETGVLDRIYTGLEVDDNYFRNILNLKRFKSQYHFKRLREEDSEDPVKQVSLEHNPLGWKPTYDYITNTVNVDLGLLRPPLYRTDDDLPDYVKYGQGLIMAHELGHAFDIIGNFYDSYGNRMDLDWWPDTVREKFLGFTDCLREQNKENAGGISKATLLIDHIETLNNNIADLASFFVTYAGLSIHLRIHGDADKPIPGFTLNKKQIYFLQAAQTYCELREKPSSDSASRFLFPPKLRVNGAIANTEDFGHVFNCSLGAAMNPVTKCNLLH